MLKCHKKPTRFFFKDLFIPKGIVKWQDYKFVLLIMLVSVILIPFGIPTLLIYIKYALTSPSSTLRDSIDIWGLVDPLIIMAAIIYLYVFINLTQKMIRGFINRG